MNERRLRLVDLTDFERDLIVARIFDAIGRNFDCYTEQFEKRLTAIEDYLAAQAKRP